MPADDGKLAAQRALRVRDAWHAAAPLLTLLGVALVFGAFYIVVTMLVEVLQSLADPRIAL